ncbi:hypothetical protein MKW98_007334 [Papaver atlanticum]|uniref:Uncharacterized protein n=1 Tax=Papaver atlanticum TaxID=357466 RepID=A0AAD4SC75_9MAGN|nr:hypothetical protein MKW98_007334 [Papaver atlanticum]
MQLHIICSVVNVDKVLPVANKEETHEQDFLAATCIGLDLPASSHNAGVAAGVTVKAKSEEDSLSTTSTIEYGSDYTEEQYSAHTEDEVDEKYSTSELRTPSIWPRNECENKDEWVASWKELCKFRHWTWIDVYAYFNKGQGYGGYGVILRDALAKPIIASAKFSKDGKSFFYQVFMRIKAGVELADRHKRSFLNVQCNSIMVAALFRDARECFNSKCRDTSYPNYICERCEIFFSSYIGWRRIRRLLVSLVVELRGKNIVVTDSIGSEAASHYVAKREKMIKRREVEKKEESRIAPDDDKPGEMKPDDFPPELINILWEDAFATLSDYTALPEFSEDYAM